jgi:hypothetical protein
MASFRHNYLILDLPDGWEDSSDICVRGPEDHGFRPNLVFSQEPTEPGESAAEFAHRQLRSLREALTDYFLVREGEAAFGPNKGFLREHVFSMKNSDVAQMQFYCVINDRAYTFTFTHLRDEMATARPIWERLLTAARLEL